MTVAPASRLNGYPKSARLRKRREYLSAQEEGRRRHVDGFVVIVARRPGGPCRLGVTVSRRVGNAVVRNRLKRLVREAFRECRWTLGPERDVVVIAKPAAAGVPPARLGAEIRRALVAMVGG